MTEPAPLRLRTRIALNLIGWTILGLIYLGAMTSSTSVHHSRLVLQLVVQVTAISFTLWRLLMGRILPNHGHFTTFELVVLAGVWLVAPGAPPLLWLVLGLGLGADILWSHHLGRKLPPT